MLNPNLSNLDRSATSSANSFSPKQRQGDELTHANNFKKHLKNLLEQLPSKQKQRNNVNDNSAEPGKLEIVAEDRKTELDFQEVHLTQITDASLKEDPEVETSIEDAIVEPAPASSPPQIERGEDKNSAMNTDQTALLFSDVERNFEGSGKLPNSPIEFAPTNTGGGAEFDTKRTAAEVLDVNKIELNSVAKPDSLSQTNTQDPAISLGEKTILETGQAAKHTSDVSKTIATRIVETLTNEAPTAESPGSKKITLTLNPAELGKLTLQVGWENETLKALIIATDMNTTDLLNRDKNLLLDTLNENGLSFGEFDISHGAADPDASESSEQQTTFDTFPNSPELASTTDPPIRYGESGRGSVVNIVI